MKCKFNVREYGWTGTQLHSCTYVLSVAMFTLRGWSCDPGASDIPGRPLMESLPTPRLERRSAVGVNENASRKLSLTLDSSW